VKPTALTDAQLAMITAAAKPLHHRDRAPFLEAVAARLRAVDEIGDGVVSRIVRELQRSFLPRAPQLDADDYTPRNSGSKYH
jgi:hypothetical protein